jgi:hypothetical protein
MAAAGLRTLSMRKLKDGRVFSAGAGYDYGDGDLTPVAGSGAGASPAKPAFRTRKGGPLDIPPEDHHLIIVTPGRSIRAPRAPVRIWACRNPATPVGEPAPPAAKPAPPPSVSVMPGSSSARRPEVERSHEWTPPCRRGGVRARRRTWLPAGHERRRGPAACPFVRRQFRYRRRNCFRVRLSSPRRVRRAS